MTSKIPLIMGCAILLSGCDGRDLTGPNAGRAEAVVQDAGGTMVTGSVVGNMFASVRDGARWLDLGSPNGITIPLQTTGRVTTVHGEQSLPTGDYTRVRLVLQAATARVASGSVIGGVALTNEATLTLGGTDQRVELSVDVPNFEIVADSDVRRVIVFDLRSQQWLTPAALQAGRVEDSAMQSAVTATTRAERR